MKTTFRERDTTMTHSKIGNEEKIKGNRVEESVCERGIAHGTGKHAEEEEETGFLFIALVWFP